MVNFGAQLHNHAANRWSQHYVRYNAMKASINSAGKRLGESVPASPSLAEIVRPALVRLPSKRALVQQPLIQKEMPFSPTVDPVPKLVERALVVCCVIHPSLSATVRSSCFQCFKTNLDVWNAFSSLLWME
jgi:hypothetical protein